MRATSDKRRARRITRLIGEVATTEGKRRECKIIAPCSSLFELAPLRVVLPSNFVPGEREIVRDNHRRETREEAARDPSESINQH